MMVLGFQPLATLMGSLLQGYAQALPKGSEMSSPLVFWMGPLCSHVARALALPKPGL